jgi:hypothetical protein
MSRFGCVTSALLAIAVTAPLAAERSSHDFEGHTFSLQLPPGYVLHAAPSPRRGFKTFGFSTEARDDGTRGMIQVSLVDFSKAPAGETVSLEKFAAAMISGVRQRRSRWEQNETDIQIDGVRAKRIEWAGSTETGFGRPPVNMRGVMIAGVNVKQNLGFSLHTQDVVAFADSTLTVCEQALHTFALAPRR